MTVITQSYTKDAIKNAIAELRNTTAPSQPARSKIRYYSLQDELDDLREQLIKFTADNPLSITSAGDLGGSYENMLEEFLEEYESDGLTFEQLKAVVHDAYNEGARQQVLRENARLVQVAKLEYPKICAYSRLHPTVTCEDFMTSPRIFFRNILEKDTRISKEFLTQFFERAIADEPFFYPYNEQGEALTNPKLKTSDPDPEPEFLSTQEVIALWNRENPQPASAPVPVVKETTSPQEAPGTPVAPIVAPEPVKASIPENVDRRTGECLEETIPKKPTQATHNAEAIRLELLTFFRHSAKIAPTKWYTHEEIHQMFTYTSHRPKTKGQLLVRSLGSIKEDMRILYIHHLVLRKIEYQHTRNKDGMPCTTKRFRYHALPE